MAAISYVQTPTTESDENHGHGLIGAAALVYTGIAVSFNLSSPSAIRRHPHAADLALLDITRSLQLSALSHRHQGARLSCRSHLSQDAKGSLRCYQSLSRPDTYERRR